jgi:hypothetical protein
LLKDGFEGFEDFANGLMEPGFVWVALLHHGEDFMGNLRVPVPRNQ